jgi:hypothetical protein
MEKRRQDQSCLFRRGDHRTKGHNSKNTVLESISNEDGSVARKLSTIEERRQDRRCLFRRGDYRNKCRHPDKSLRFESR